jgi:hypothetical protein
VKLSSKGLLSWEMKYVPREGGNSGFSIIPAGKADVTRCRICWDAGARIARRRSFPRDPRRRGGR